MTLGKTGSDRASSYVPISLRCFTGEYRNAATSHNENSNSGVVLTLSIETRPDQNFSYGSCGIWINEKLFKICIFYDESLDSKKIELLKQDGEALQKGCDVMVCSKIEFVRNVLYPYVYTARARLVGFDLPFVLSRLASSCSIARKIDGAFSIKLAEDSPWLAAIRIKSINNASFMQFATPLRKKSEKKIPFEKTYRGYFLDLRTLGYAVSNDSFDTVHELAETFGCDMVKIPSRKTRDAIKNNIENTLALHKLYCTITFILQDTFLVKQNHANRLYSPASIGKMYLEKLNIEPFLTKNPDFPKEILGYLMGAYYGGRVETRIRKKPVRITCLDFTSMYPSMFLLQDMYRFLVAKKIEISHTRQETQRFLDEITLEDMPKKETWKQMITLCKIKPDNDILPIRSSYDDSKKAQNIGVNYLKSTDGTCLWYALADIIASKLLTGKTILIEDAISFVPVGVQDLAENVEIFKNVTVNPKVDNFIQKLIEKRLETKQKLEENASLGLERIIQNTIKIIANTVSYGDYIQVNSEKASSRVVVPVYGIEEPFYVDARTLAKTESPSKHFNPIIGVFLTAGARLVLGAAERLVRNNGGYISYMDTDAIFVSPRHAGMIQGFFQRLNPYDRDVPMFKVEKENEKPLENVLFYGISSKRYVLYDYDMMKNEFAIYKHTSHGLGHLLDVDERQWWQDILEMHYFPEKRQEILARYDNRYAVSENEITTPNVWKKFPKQKPFDKILVGAGYKKDDENMVMPTLPYINAKKRQCVQYMPFRDYSTGERFPNSADTILYWKPLSLVLEEYAEHREAKSGGNTGLLSRLHVKINRNSIRYMGKETSLDTNEISYVQYDDVSEKILAIRPKDSWKIGLSRSNLMSLRKKAKNGQIPKLHNFTLHKILENSILVTKKKREVIIC